MKTALILAYDFPPYVSVGGLRPYSWYKYFKEFGIYPVVITRQWNNKYGNHLDYIAPSEHSHTIIENTEYGTIIRTPYKPNLANRLLLKYGNNRYNIIRKAVSLGYEIGQWLLPLGPKYNLYKAAKEYLKLNKTDIIIATGEPFVLFRYAALLNRQFSIPWIADYRDPWTQNKNRSKNILLYKFNALLEKKYLSNVRFIVTVSDFVEKHIKTLIDNKDIEVIINGYDPEVIPIVLQTKPDNENLVISYAGTIYDWHPVENFLEQCNTFVTKIKIKNLKINFYGINKEEYIKSLINAKFKDLVDLVFFYKKLPNKQLIQKLAESHLLLLFNDYPISGTKIYDYLAAKRQILFCYSHDEKALQLKKKHYNIEESLSDNNHIQEDIIKETNSGVIVRDEEHLLEVMEKTHLDLKTKGFINCNSHKTGKFSRKIQVEKFTEVIKNINTL